ncbi:hypothetical protein [Nocardioides gilvus]|uniref:hypothetical protein n=1 Tax=Nocardioides gilvus TaxID=1735589 RepID=UPI0013A54D8B|nr:hypothetical protein [Nocardioides gilvus]
MTGLGAQARAVPTDRRPPPLVALRTYRFLRLGVLAMLGMLTVSVTWHNLQGDNEVLDSISAYYYTPVQSIFVGTLVTLGFVLIVLWGKTSAEDGLLNVAGMLAPIVAFVPTRNLARCDLLARSGDEIQIDPTPSTLNEACKAAVVNNVGSYFIVLGLMLTLLAAIGWYGRRQDPPWPWVSRDPHGYWWPLAGAWALFLLAAGTWIFLPETFYAVAHFTAASLMFVLIIGAIVVIAREKRYGIPMLDETPDVQWGHVYMGLAVTMSVGAVAVGGSVAAWSHLTEHGDYWVLAVEIWLLFWLAVFWAIQTWDRWNDGAPSNPV